MNPVRELELRNQLSDFILNWHTDGKPESLESADIENFKQLIIESSIVVDESHKSLKQWVQAGRRAGLKWVEIGELLGFSRQAAQQRFSDSKFLFGNETDLETQNENQIIISDVNAFNEKVIMKQQGLKGRKLVGVGWMKLFFIQTTNEVENIRKVSLKAGGDARYEAYDWIHVASWFHYRYYTRSKPSQ